MSGNPIFKKSFSFTKKTILYNSNSAFARELFTILSQATNLIAINFKIVGIDKENIKMNNRPINATTPLPLKLENFLPTLQDMWGQKGHSNNGHYRKKLQRHNIFGR